MENPINLNNWENTYQFILAKMRQQERENQLMSLSQENQALKDAVKRRNQEMDRLKADYDKLKNYVNSLPQHLVPSWIGAPSNH